MPTRVLPFRSEVPGGRPWLEVLPTKKALHFRPLCPARYRFSREIRFRTLPSLLSADERYVVLVRYRLRVSGGGMLHIIIADNTPTSQKQPGLDARVSTCITTCYSASRGEGVGGRSKRSGVPCLPGRDPEPHSCEDVNAGGLVRTLNYLCDIATIGILNDTPRTV